MRWLLAIGCVALPGMLSAFEPVLPEGTQLLEETSSATGVYEVPIGPFDATNVPSERYVGDLRRRSWRLNVGFADTATLNADLAAQLLSQGYEIIFACETEGCGGFDFRFNTEVLLPPHMFVDLSDFLFLSGVKDSDEQPDVVGVLISRTKQAGMLQVIDIGPREQNASQKPPSSTQTTPENAAGTLGGPTSETLRPNVVIEDDVAAWLKHSGHVVLSDLEFETGSSRLGEGPFRSLEALAAFLNEDTTRRLALVGHTDSVGSLEQNTELSRKRASAVRARLVETYQVPSEQLEARGVGYLSPIASNLGEDGRNANRRVEAILLNTE